MLHKSGFVVRFYSPLCEGLPQTLPTSVSYYSF